MVNLTYKMRQLADTQSAEVRELLLKRAADLDKAAEGFFAQEQSVSVEKFMGAWTRARRLWCDITKEPLI